MKTLEQREEERKEIISKVDPKDVQAVIDDFPHNSLLPDRIYNCFSVHDDLSKLSEEKIRSMIEVERQSEIHAIPRYERYRENGLEAVSLYDLTLSPQDSPLVSLRTALELTSAHITYPRKRILELLAELKKYEEQLSLF